MGKKNQPFTKEVVCAAQPEVPGKIFSELGSKHRVKRRKIKIDNIEELKIADIQDPIIKQLIKRSK